MQTVWDPKKSTLEFLADFFLHVANNHINTLYTIYNNLKKFLWW